LAEQLLEGLRLFAACGFSVELILKVGAGGQRLVLTSELSDSGCVHQRFAPAAALTPNHRSTSESGGSGEW
jgi:hypothetical protein